MRDILIALMQSLPIIIMWAILIFQNKQILKQKQQIRGIVNVLEKIAENMTFSVGVKK